MLHDAQATTAAAAAAMQNMIQGELLKCCPAAAAVVALDGTVGDPPAANGTPPATPACALQPLRSGLWRDKGKRATMEDEHVQMDDLVASFPQFCLGESERQAFYGIFDGHGGTGASAFVRDHLVRHIIQDPVFPRELSSVFLRAYEQTDLEFEKTRDVSGTTALAALITGPSILVANVGDCRAVLSRRGVAFELSTDQRPDTPAEKARIIAAGGYVVEDYLNGELGVARALGDWHMTGIKELDPLSQRPIGPLSAVPEIRETTLTGDDEFLLLGCDGLWNVFSSQSAVDFARRRLQEHNSPQQCAEELVAEALKRETDDNLTVVMVCFGPDPPLNLSVPWRRRRMVPVGSLENLQAALNARC